jgi:hypothetical protein
MVRRIWNLDRANDNAAAARIVDSFCRRNCGYAAVASPSGASSNREKNEMALGSASVDCWTKRPISFYAGSCSRVYYFIGERIGKRDGTFIDSF